MKLLACLCLIAAASCRSAPPAGSNPSRGPSDVESLFAADRAFAESVSERGLDAWVEAFDPNAAKVAVTGDVVRGHDEIRRTSAALFSDPTVKFFWDPEIAGMITPGELGFTRGRYTLVELEDNGSERTLGAGTYLTVWHWTAAGWKVALDFGVAEQ